MKYFKMLIPISLMFVVGYLATVALDFSFTLANEPDTALVFLSALLITVTLFFTVLVSLRLGSWLDGALPTVTSGSGTGIMLNIPVGK